jgi:deoxyribose-phosphate aldolase
MPESLAAVAKLIDHSLLHPALTDDELRKGCELAVQYHVASVCIKPCAVTLAAEALEGSDVAVGTVVGFPHGNSHIGIKAAEAGRACADGAVELDVVLNIGKVLSRDWAYVDEEIGEVHAVARRNRALLKVIFENDFLTDDAFKVELCKLCSRHAIDFVKTSTGYGFVRQKDGSYNYRGATDHDLELMRRECIPSVQVKAAGGVRTLDDVLRVRRLGATRIGASATQAILEEAKRRGYA